MLATATQRGPFVLQVVHVERGRCMGCGLVTAQSVTVTRVIALQIGDFSLPPEVLSIVDHFHAPLTSDLENMAVETL